MACGIGLAVVLECGAIMTIADLAMRRSARPFHRTAPPVLAVGDDTVRLDPGWRAPDHIPSSLTMRDL